MRGMTEKRVRSARGGDARTAGIACASDAGASQARRSGGRAPWRRRAADALRCLLAFVMAFSLTSWAQTAAFAAGNGGTGGTGGTKPTVVALFLYQQQEVNGAPNWVKVASTLDEKPAPHGQITSKGGTLAFNLQLVWDDGNTSDAGGIDHPVTWSIDNPDVASVTSTGEVAAKANGTAVLTARADGLAISFTIDVSGQENELYVSSVTMVKDDGTPYGQDGIALSDLNQTANPIARVTVVDPATGTSRDYYSNEGTLSKQTSGAIPDLLWTINDTQSGTIDAVSGQYRPTAYMKVEITATSAAGLGGEPVTGSVWVTTSAEDQPDIEAPQETLTLTLTYENAPEGYEPKVVTMSVADVAALGSYQQAFTVLGKGQKFLISAVGVSLASVLRKAGVAGDTNADLAANIRRISFQTADHPEGYEYWVSGDGLFGTTRYYWPELDVDSNAGGTPAEPMLALQTNEQVITSITGQFPGYSSLTDNQRFRLLFGMASTNEITGFRTTKWINGMTVTLAGGPSTTEEPPKGDPDPKREPYTGDETGSGEGLGSGEGGGLGSGSGGAVGSGEGTGDAPGEGEQGGGGGAGIGDGDATGKEWSVYQIMNKYHNDLDDPELENPWSPFVLPSAAGVAAAGATQMGVRYRRQRKPIR